MEKVISGHVSTMEIIKKELNKAFKEGFKINFSEIVEDNYVVYLIKQEEKRSRRMGRKAH